MRRTVFWPLVTVGGGQDSSRQAAKLDISMLLRQLLHCRPSMRATNTVKGAGSEFGSGTNWPPSSGIFLPHLRTGAMKEKSMKRYLVLAASLTFAALSFAAQAQGGTNLTIRNELGGNRMCMDASLDHPVRDGDPVYVYRCHGRENQRWTVTQSVGGESALVGLNGYCLDVRGASHEVGTPVQLYQCHFGANQKFRVQQGGQIKDVSSGKCLASLGTSDRSPIVLDYCQRSPNQAWLFER
jgi:hypothetical protein